MINPCLPVSLVRLSAISQRCPNTVAKRPSIDSLPRPSPICHLPLTRTPPFIHMSHNHPTGPSSQNFQLIFNNALKAYEKHTKNDLRSHPLAAQLQACHSPGSILTVLQQQVQDLDQSRTSDEWLTKWLDPTVNVLYAFSETLGEGVSLVRLVI